jgi:hypothetical protein
MEAACTLLIVEYSVWYEHSEIVSVPDVGAEIVPNEFVFVHWDLTEYETIIRRAAIKHLIILYELNF